MATLGYTPGKEYKEESRWYDKDDYTIVDGKCVHMADWKLEKMKSELLANGWEEVDSFIRDGAGGSKQAVLIRKKC